MRPSYYLLPVLVVLIALGILVLVLYLPSGPVPERPAERKPTLFSPELPSRSVAGVLTPHPTPRRADLSTGLAGREGAETLIAGPTIRPGTAPALESVEPESGGILGTPVPARTPSATAEAEHAAPDYILGAVYSGRRMPLAGVTIQAASITTTSGSDGRFRLQGLKGARVDLVVSREGYQTVTRKNVRLGTKDLSIILIEDNHLAGRVVDQYGKPVSFARVSLRALRGIWMLSLECDIGGTFEASNVPNAQIQIAASREGLTDTGGGSVVVEAPHPELVLLRLQRPTFSISGYVRMADTGQGVAGFTLVAQKQDEPQSQLMQAITAGNGAFSFDELDVGVYLVRSDTATNQDLNLVVPAKEDNKTIRIFDKSVENVLFRAMPGFTVSGRVVGPDGRGVAGARVTLAPQESSLGYRASAGRIGEIAGLPGVETTSRVDGIYELRGIPWAGEPGDMQGRVFATHPQYGSGVSDPFSVQPGAGIAENVNVTLTGSATISGHVVGEGRDVVQGARVVLVDLFQGARMETMTDQGGAFLFERVPIVSQRLSPIRGTHTLIVEKEGYATKKQDILVNSQTIEPFIVLLERGGFIQGRVVDGNGRGVPGVAVTVVMRDGERHAGSTDDAGVFFVTGLEPGAYDLLFHLDSKPPMYGALYQVETGTNDAVVQLRGQSWTVMGTVFDARERGKRITRYELAVEGRLKDPQAGSFVKRETLNTPDGTYQLTFYEPGVYYIHFAAEGYQPWDGSVAMTPETNAVQFVNAWLEPLQTTATIRGSIDLPPNESLALIEVLGHGSFPPASPTTFVLDGIPSGTHRIIFYVRREGQAGAEILGVLPAVTVRPNRTRDLGVIDPALFGRVSVRGF